MNAADKKRLEELEQRVKQLEAERYYPVFVPYVPVAPSYPQPYYQPWWSGTTTGASITSSGPFIGT